METLVVVGSDCGLMGLGGGGGCGCSLICYAKHPYLEVKLPVVYLCNLGYYSVIHIGNTRFPVSIRIISEVSL